MITPPSYFMYYFCSFIYPLLLRTSTWGLRFHHKFQDLHLCSDLVPPLRWLHLGFLGTIFGTSCSLLCGLFQILHLKDSGRDWNEAIQKTVIWRIFGITFIILQLFWVFFLTFYLNTITPFSNGSELYIYFFCTYITKSTTEKYYRLDYLWGLLFIDIFHIFMDSILIRFRETSWSLAIPLNIFRYDF